MTNTPVFAQTPKTGKSFWDSTLTANTKSDGTGTIATDMIVAFTAGANGSFVEKLRATIAAIVAGTASTASVIRIYVSTKTSGATTKTDTRLIAEISVPSQTADQATVQTYPFEYPLNFRLGANETILVSMHHAAAANTVWGFLVPGMDY